MSKEFFRPLSRVESFTAKLGIRLPILLAPMAGACPPPLSIAVANAGGMGACGALLMTPESIHSWVDELRQQSKGEFQINLWIPGSSPIRDPQVEKRQREFLASWGPPVSTEMGESVLPDFDAQCRAMIAARPKVISSNSAAGNATVSWRACWRNSPCDASAPLTPAKFPSRIRSSQWKPHRDFRARRSS